MRKIVLSPHLLESFLKCLQQDEKAVATIEKYRRDIYTFYKFLPDGKEIEKERIIQYKQNLLEKGYAVASINSMLVAVNQLLCYIGADNCRVRLLKQQRRIFCDQEKELTRDEYMRLVNAAQGRGDVRLALVLQTICSTGIRVSELQYITIQSLHRKEAQVNSKGKIRKVLLPQMLCHRLLGYCRQKGIQSGSVFVSSCGKPVNRSNIWAAMKKLCELAGVAAQKVFPHNLRHLFARTFYKQHKDIVRLADILGHSSIDTTRIYTLTSGMEQLGQLARMRLLI